MNIDIIYGFAVNSEWKKIMPETNVKCDLGSREWYIEIQMYILLGERQNLNANWKETTLSLIIQIYFPDLVAAVSVLSYSDCLCVT